MFWLWRELIFNKEYTRLFHFGMHETVLKLQPGAFNLHTPMRSHFLSSSEMEICCTIERYYPLIHMYEFYFIQVFAIAIEYNTFYNNCIKWNVKAFKYWNFKNIKERSFMHIIRTGRGRALLQIHLYWELKIT